MTWPAWLCLHSRATVGHMSFPYLRLWRYMLISILLWDLRPRLTERHSQPVRDQLQDTAQDFKKTSYGISSTKHLLVASFISDGKSGTGNILYHLVLAHNTTMDKTDTRMKENFLCAVLQWIGRVGTGGVWRMGRTSFWNKIKNENIARREPGYLQSTFQTNASNSNSKSN